MREVYIRSAACLEHDPAGDFSLVKHELERNSGKKFRRVNRFIVLSLASVYRLPDISQIDAECSLHLGTKHGCAADSFGMLQQMYQDTLIPLPFTFINTSPNMAGFYIAQSLGLSGENYTFSQPWGSFEKAFSLAYRNVRSGRNESALAGSCDEAVFIAGDVYKVLDMREDDTLLEGGCWMHLSSRSDGALAELHRVCSSSSLQEIQEAYRTFEALDNTEVMIDPAIEPASIEIRDALWLRDEPAQLIGSPGGKKLIFLLQDTSCKAILYLCKEGLARYTLWSIKKL